MLRRIVIIAALATLATLAAGCGGSGSDEPASPYIEGRTVFGNVCSACHGNAGQGGVGPEMSGVLETFPSCEDHIRWITLGSDRWKAEVGPTYGATDKEVKGGMQELGQQLSEDEIVAAAVYERSRFGGIEPEEAEAQCGVAPPDDSP